MLVQPVDSRPAFIVLNSFQGSLSDQTESQADFSAATRSS